MRYWGKNIEIDGSFYDRAGSLLPTAVEMAQLKATGNFYQYEGNAAFYEETIQNMLKEIERNDVGKILIQAINQSPKSVRIIPLTGKEQFQKGKIPCANPVGGFSQKGSHCVIWYEPWSRMFNLFTGQGSSPYQVLVHELQHALRQLRGKWYATGPLLSLTNVQLFPNAEELFSVTIENMYLSAAREPQRMLGAYSQNIPLGTRTDRDFYKQYGNELEAWCKELPDMTVQLERLYGIWNPIGVRRGVLDFVITL
jgi:hypothetical protein